jgi:prepilin-type N-terminal cleavage/methylation domain-containing protein
MKFDAQHRRAGRRAGFTLVEVLTVAAIITFLVGVTIAGLAKGTENGRAAGIAGAVHQIKITVKSFADDHGGVVPVTETASAAVIPTSGAAFGAASPIALSNAIILDTVLLTERHAERAVQLPAGTNPLPVNSGSPEVLWDVALQRFKINPDAVPQRDYSLCNRTECQITSAIAPAAAKGSNFQLDGVSDLRAGRRVVSAVLPNVPASLALRISQKLDGDRFSTDAATADGKGAVVYNTPANGLTDVYIYVLDV